MGRVCRLCLAAGGIGIIASFFAPLRADPPTPPAKTPAMTPPTNAAPVVHPPDTLGRYGKILMPGDDTGHPLKLKMPFPGVGEVKVPSQDEINMREKLEQLAELSDSDLHLQLDQWPAFGRMSLRDEGAMLQRIQDFRDYRTKVALQKAHDMGLLTLTPEQKITFEKDYWDKRLEMDRELAKQFQPIYRAREQQLEDGLFREYSSAGPGPVAQTPPPVAQKKPAPSAPSAPATNSVRPVAQTRQ
ncbi:MAG TPA: hypothetical protein VGZ93_03595 [Candidatus Methylacidiphilales bacterium]|jgi:hypothetical protein|nr:hypothetical protein [Candidatus Methylacidiphilales bacterium]